MSNPSVTLASVACASAASCAAAGTYLDSAGIQQGLLEKWSGTAWTPAEAPLPADAIANPSVALVSVACASAASCVADGQYIGSAANGQGLLETWSP